MRERPLRTAGDPLHLPLLNSIHPSVSPQVAFRTPTQWARRLVAGSVDAVLVSVAGDPKQALADFVPRCRNPAVEVIPLGRRPLLLLHNPSLESSGDSAPETGGGSAQWEAGGNRRGPPQGYLLPPRDHQPCLHQLLEHSGQLPLYPCSAAEPLRWLEQLAAVPLLLPADLTLLTMPPGGVQAWCRCGRSARWWKPYGCCYARERPVQPALRQLVQWWGGQGVPRPQATGNSALQKQQGAWRWPWGRP